MAPLYLGDNMLGGDWESIQDRCSPGMSVDQKRMVWITDPSLSITWKYTGVRAGTRQKAEPSASIHRGPISCSTKQALPENLDRLSGIAFGRLKE